MFAFGDYDWPGLAKLSEEMGEVQQIIGKLMMTKGKAAHWDGSNLFDRFQDELADLLAAVRFNITMLSQRGYCEQDFNTRVMEKEKLFALWHESES